MQFTLGNVIDIVLAVLFLVAVFRGWCIGLAMKIGHLAALVGASILANVVANILKTTVSSQWVLPYLEQQAGAELHTSAELEQGISLVAENIAFYFLFSILFVVTMIIFRHLVAVLKLVDRIPVVGTLNKAGGALVGFLIEFIFFFILGRILFGMIPMESWAQVGLTKGMIEETYLLQAFVP